MTSTGISPLAGSSPRPPATHDSYCSLAGEYDHLLGDVAESTWRSGIVAELSRLATPGQGGVITDLGAGTGIGGRLIAGAGLARRLIGIDRSAHMLKHARSYDSRLIADMTMLPSSPSSADFIVSGFDTLNYLSPAHLRYCLARRGAVPETGQMAHLRLFLTRAVTPAGGATTPMTRSSPMACCGGATATTPPPGNASAK